MQFIEFDTIDSTNTYLKDNWEQLEDLTFVSTLEQTAGRGRNQRKWLSPKGENMMFSVLIKDRDLLNRYRYLSMLSALTVIDALEHFVVKDLMIKWPNDVYVRDRKICGILLEGVSREQLECVIIGIGVNVNQKVFTDDYLNEPTSVIREIGQVTDLNEFRTAVYWKMIGNLQLLKEGHDFHQEIMKRDYLKGRKVYAEINGEKAEVEVTGINEDCSLGIIWQNRKMNIDSGEITFHL